MSKATETQVKNAFKSLFISKGADLIKPISDGGLGIEKIKQLFGTNIDDMDDFMQVVDNIGGSAYNFIKVQ